MATQSVNNKSVSGSFRQSAIVRAQVSTEQLRRVVWWSFWLLIIASGLLLSQWQWQRAAEKQALLQQQQQTDSLVNPHLAPQNLSEVILTGQFLDTQSRWLDNRTLNGQVGVALLTPFVDVHGRGWLVDRGFMDTQGSREALDQWLPQADEGKDLLVIHGLWQTLDGTASGFVLDEQPEGKRIPRIDLMYWPEETYHFSGVLHLQENSQGLGERHRWWQPYQLTPEKHLGYSLQWFLLAVVALVFAITGRR